MNCENLAWMNGQQAPTTSPGFFGRQAVRSLPVHTASISTNFIVGTSRNHSSSAQTIVTRMLDGELNSRVRRKPMKPVVFTGAGRSGISSWRTKTDEGVSLIRPCSGRSAIHRNS